MCLSSVLLNLILSSCTAPPDKPVCVEINPSKAFCTYTIKDVDFYWDDNHKYENKTYWEAKPSMVLVPISSWIEIKSYIIKMCKKHQDCNDNIGTWERKVISIDSKINLKKENVK